MKADLCDSSEARQSLPTPAAGAAVPEARNIKARRALVPNLRGRRRRKSVLRETKNRQLKIQQKFNSITKRHQNLVNDKIE